MVIDPGHGGRDPGAIGAIVKEKNFNLSIALRIGDIIKVKHPDVQIIYTRKTDKFIPLIERVQIANTNKADLFISIHANSVKNKKVFGTETYTLGLSKSEENLEVAKKENSVILLEDNYKITYEGFDPNSSESYIIFEMMQNQHLDRSVSFASKIQKEFSQNAKRTDRGVRQAEFIVLKETGMPCVLIEFGFLSNLKEEKYLNTNEGKRSLARCVARSFDQFKLEHDRKKTFKASNAIKTESQTDLVYKVQILTANKKLNANAPNLKKYYKDTTYYMEQGMYKYTLGESNDKEEISILRNSLLNDYKDAFIIAFKNGEKIK
ncbi:N-acetylmuramoyl-L-alanine amidase [Bacteroidales bacterium]|nr:N-acetylmuramoyl-L-alanine amidase [Bacteroidales bacterium]